MDLLNVASATLQVAAIFVGTVAASTSSRFNIQRANRDLTKLLDSLKTLQHKLDHFPAPCERETLRHIERDLVQMCEGLRSTLSLVTDRLVRKELPSCSVTVRSGNASAIGNLVGLVQEVSVFRQEREPVLWRLHRWSSAGMSRLLGTKTIPVPDVIKSPSPYVLLASWLILALAAAAYHESRPEREDRAAYLFASAFVAVLLGMVEQSGMETVILTNVPWCLAMGMLLDISVRAIYGLRHRKDVEEPLQREVWDVKEEQR